MIENAITWEGVDWNMWPRGPSQHTEGYVIRTTTIDGLWMPDFTTETHKRPGFIGDRSFDQFPAGSLVTLSGTIRAIDMPHLRTGQQRMYKAWWQGLGPTSSHLRFQLAGTPLLYMAVRLGQKPDMVEQIPGDQPVRTWTFSLRADDPRVYKDSDNSLYYDWQVLTAP